MSQLINCAITMEDRKGH